MKRSVQQTPNGMVMFRVPGWISAGYSIIVHFGISGIGTYLGVVY